MIKSSIEQDLKKAMLAGDKPLVSALRNLKSAILYAEKATGSQNSELSEPELISLFQKEAKKRQESADLYQKADSKERADNELFEKKVIDGYLPTPMSEEEITQLIDTAISEIGNEKKNMGQIIGYVKTKSAGSADGALTAKIVQGKLQS